MNQYDFSEESLKKCRIKLDQPMSKEKKFTEISINNIERKYWFS